jgi:hypothetical protein
MTEEQKERADYLLTSFTMALSWQRTTEVVCVRGNGTQAEVAEAKAGVVSARRDIIQFMEELAR